MIRVILVLCLIFYSCEKEMVIAPTNLTVTAISGGVRLTWEDQSDNEHGFEVWRKIDTNDYILLTTTEPNIETYDDMDYQIGTLKYKVRAKGGDQCSLFTTKDAPAPLEFVFTSTGDGSGLGVFNLEVSETVTATIDGTGKFYTDLAGTTGESSTKVFTVGALRRTYIKVPSGIATLRIKNVVIKWGANVSGSDPLNDGWDTYVYGDNSSTNCPRVSIDVATMTYNTSINVFGLNTLYGDLSGNSIMTYMEIADGTPDHTTPGHGGATVHGDISLMPLNTFDCWDDTHFTGTCVSADMFVIWCNGLNEVTFNLSVMPSLQTLIINAGNSCNVIGDISLCPNLVFVQVSVSNSISGSIVGNIALEYIYIVSGNTITVPNVTNVTKLGYLQITGFTPTSANVNQILADIWTNRNVARVYTSREIYLNGTPTGQGLTDKTNLQAYRSPNNDAGYSLWTISTL